MFERLRQRGIDARFVLFVMITMPLSTVIGGLVAVVASFVQTGSAELLLAGPFIAMIGGGFLIPVAFFAWLVPSAVVFSVTLSVFRRWYDMKPSAQWAGTTTAFVAGVVLTLVLTGFGRDWDGLGGLMFAIGPAAVLISPFVAGYIYS